MTDQKSIFGHFDEGSQTIPTYDPGMDVLCPVCLFQLYRPVVTTSLMKPGDDRSFFYRVHKHCSLIATDSHISEIESSLIDAKDPVNDGGRDV
jgi:hypothetical protein